MPLTIPRACKVYILPITPSGSPECQLNQPYGCITKANLSIVLEYDNCISSTERKQFVAFRTDLCIAYFAHLELVVVSVQVSEDVRCKMYIWRIRTALE